MQQAEPPQGAAIAGDHVDPVIIHSFRARGAELTSSYEEEKAALLVALNWAWADCPTERIPIPLLKAHQRGANDTHSIPKRLDNRKGSTILMWEPSHEVIPGN